MTEADRVNEKVGNFFIIFEDFSAGIVDFANNYVADDWLIFIGLLLAVILIGMMGLRSS